MPSTHSYGKAEKLKSRTALNALFTGGQSFSVFPVKVFYSKMNEAAAVPVKAGVGVSARNFRKAVDRNRIKRLLRESYRLQKASLHEKLTAKQSSLAVFFLFTGKELPDQPLLMEKMRAALAKLEEKIG